MKPMLVVHMSGQHGVAVEMTADGKEAIVLCRAKGGLLYLEPWKLGVFSVRPTFSRGDPHPVDMLLSTERKTVPG